nr:calcium-dependent protein kinase 20-like [Ipomoea batatas]
MGNTCAGPKSGTGTGNNGFLQSVSAAVWKPNEIDGGCSSGTTAPAPLKIAGEDNKNKSHIKKVASAGLQVDSVLGRKAANIKDTYVIGKKLGQGQFGTTFLCMEKATKKEFACKTIAKRKLTTEEDVEDVRRELHIMHHLEGHPNVVQIMGAYEDAVAVHLVMEVCSGGELFERIIQRGHYTEKKAAQLARVIMGVVEACHSLGVMHRDLKPENFLFISEGEEAPLKAIDFGLSVFFRPGEIFTEVVGSPYYVAPEVLRKQYGQACDIWSAGVIIYILLSGVPPFWDETEQGIFEQVLKGNLDFVSEPWPNISDSAKDLVKKMLIRDPKRRPTAHEILCHPWVRVGGVAPDKPLDSAVLSRLKQFSAMNKLKKIAIRVIAETLSEEEIAGLKEMFKMIDTDNSGQITLEELKKGLERAGANLQDSEIYSLLQALIQERLLLNRLMTTCHVSCSYPTYFSTLFFVFFSQSPVAEPNGQERYISGKNELADTDNNGTIDYGEFIAAMLHLNKIQKEDHMFTAFSYFDKDGSGYITQDELQQACEKFGLMNAPIEEILSEVDQDNDGRIDYSEFVAMMRDSAKGSQNTAEPGSGGSSSETPPAVSSETPPADSSSSETPSDDSAFSTLAVTPWRKTDNLDTEPITSHEVPADKKASVKLFVQSAMQATQTKTQDFITTVVDKRLKDPQIGTYTKDCLQTCKEVYEDSEDAMKKTMEDVDEGNYFKANVDVSAISSDAETCKDCVKMVYGQDPELDKFNKWVDGVIDKCLTMITGYKA